MSNDKIHYKEFFLKYYNTSLRFVNSNLIMKKCSLNLSKDIVQETFIKLYENWDNIYTEEQARSFMYTTANNLCINQLRHNMVHEKYAEKIISESNPYDYIFFDEVAYQEILRHLYKAIDKLPNQTKKVIILRLRGKKNQEIANEMNLSINTIKTLKKNAYRILRDNLNNIDVRSLLFIIAILNL